MRFQCTKCGICCGDTKEKKRHILLLATEAEQIAAKTLQPIANFAVKTENKAPYMYEMRKTPEDGKCVFLNGNRCAIYAFRPLICRFYPFELRTNQAQDYEFLCTNECPGLNKGKTLSKNYFKRLFYIAQYRLRQNQKPCRNH
jgi:Fe-S-cluster containining protein